MILNINPKYRDKNLTLVYQAMEKILNKKSKYKKILYITSDKKKYPFVQITMKNIAKTIPQISEATVRTKLKLLSREGVIMTERIQTVDNKPNLYYADPQSVISRETILPHPSID